MTRITIALLAFLPLALIACARSTPASTIEPLELVVEAHEFGFTPDVIEVVVGQSVRLTLNNVGALEHDWSVRHIAVSHMREHSAQSAGHGDHMHSVGPEPDLHVAAMMGERGVLEFTATEPGEYDIVCTVAGHEEAGMVGKLVVR